MKYGYCRINVVYSSYVEIAAEEYLKYIKLIEEKKILNSKKDFDEEQDCILEKRINHSYIKIIVFSGLAVEAYIYDIAAIELTDKFVLKHLDKLSVQDKYVVIPRILSGGNIDTSKEWYSLLKKMISARNDLVHSKTKALDVERLNNDSEYSNSIFKDDLKITPKEAIKLLFLITDEMQKLENVEHNFPYLASKDSKIVLDADMDLYEKVYAKVIIDA
jgi:hypothetical protein